MPAQTTADLEPRRPRTFDVTCEPCDFALPVFDRAGRLVACTLIFGKEAASAWWEGISAVARSWDRGMWLVSKNCIRMPMRPLSPVEQSRRGHEGGHFARLIAANPFRFEVPPGPLRVMALVTLAPEVQDGQRAILPVLIGLAASVDMVQ